eukprot:3729188-Pyramimonas_sp.AAC.1
MPKGAQPAAAPAQQEMALERPAWMLAGIEGKRKEDDSSQSQQGKRSRLARQIEKDSGEHKMGRFMALMAILTKLSLSNAGELADLTC